MQDDATLPVGQNPSLERRLATIMMADVAGYSRMVGENEERTIETLRGHRQIFDELLAQHRGRVFNTAGDAILAEFPSAVDAVRCATEIQTALRTRNDHLPEEQRMWFRIGINLGDVIVQGGDLLGDGVNVAARIQTVSEPGGICLSGSVYDQIQNKLSLHFRQLGERNFKNIAQPVRTFSIVDTDGAAPRPMGTSQFRKRALAGVAAAIVVVALGAGYWQYQVREARLAEAALAAEAKLKAQREKAAAVTAQHEAKLLAELQASKDALAQAEASKRKAEQDRIAAETAQREARLQSELRAAKDAQLRAEASEKKAEDERKAAERCALPRRRKQQRPGTSAKAASPVAEPAARATAAAAGKGVERFDGAYLGRMCTTRTDGSPRCWKVALQVQRGAVGIVDRPVRSNPSRAAERSPPMEASR
jgi:class 3 adenylate cyclase